MAIGEVHKMARDGAAGAYVHAANRTSSNLNGIQKILHMAMADLQPHLRMGEVIALGEENLTL